MADELRRTFSARKIRESGEDAVRQFREECEYHFEGPVEERRRVISHHGNVTVFFAKAERKE